MDYELLQAVLGKWMLIFFVTFFVFVLIWVFRPGSRALQRDAASIPFRHDKKPIPDDEEVQS